MSPESRRLAGIFLVVLPTVVYGGVSILSLLVSDPSYMTNPLRQDLGRAGHAHAAVLIILSLVVPPYVDRANLPRALKVTASYTTPVAAILLPAAFFLSVVSPTATDPSWMINLSYVGAVVLVIGLLIIGVGFYGGRERAHEAVDWSLVNGHGTYPHCDHVGAVTKH